MIDTAKYLAGYDANQHADDYYFDADRAEQAIDWIEQHCSHVKGSLGGEPFYLEPWQQAFVGTCFGWYHRETDLRRYREVFLYIPRKNGKALALETELPTTTGWTTIGALQEGDEIIAGDGKPCKVIKLHPVEICESYRLEWSNGQHIRASADHLWRTIARADRPGKRGQGGISERIRTTRELADTLTYTRHKVNNHKMQMPEPIELPAEDLPVDPYLLGCWLGDGDSKEPLITVSKYDMPHFSRELGRDYHLKIVSGRWENLRIYIKVKGPDGKPVKPRSPDNLVIRLRQLNLINNKHIPAQYLRGSSADRLALLQGLMDTDGSASDRGFGAEISTVKQQLADGISELLASLGIKYSRFAGRAKLYKRETGPLFRFRFHSHADRLPVFRMPRKLDRTRQSPYNPKSRSTTVMLTAVEPIESREMRCITVDSPDGMFRIGRTMLPTHNSPLASAMALYVMCEDGEPGYEAVSAAGTSDQAALMYENITGMVRNNPELSKQFRIYRSPKYMVPHADQASNYKVISADAESKHGANIHLLIFDELHVQPNRELYDVLSTGTAARQQPLIISLTTADTLRENSICNEKLAYAKAVKEGTITDPTFLPVVFAAPSKANWRSLEVWKRANPNYGVSLREDYVRKEIARCEVTPSLIPNLKRFHLNIQGSAADNWLRMQDWKACPQEQQFEGPVYGGLDLATTDDITAFILFWPETGAVQCKFYLPSETAELPSRRHYQAWIESGDLTVTDGSVTDYGIVKADIVAAHEQWQIMALGYDPYNANEIATSLYNDFGVPTITVGFTMRNVSEASKKIESLVRQHTLQHGHNPVLAWMAGNCCVRTDPGGNIQPSKKYSSGKIDGIAALVTAQAVAINQPGSRSVYEDRGMITL